MHETLHVLGHVIEEPELRLPGLDPIPVEALADAFNRITVPGPIVGTVMSAPTALVIAGPGTNRDHDLALAFELAGAAPTIVLVGELIEQPELLDTAQTARYRRWLLVRRLARRRPDAGARPDDRHRRRAA